MKKLIFILIVGSLFAESDVLSTNNNLNWGIGAKIDEYPVLIFPFKWKNYLFEPIVDFDFNSEADTISNSRLGFGLSVYFNYPSKNNFNILTGIRINHINNNFNYDYEDNIKDYKVNNNTLLYAFNLGFQYKIYEDFLLSYEIGYQLERLDGGNIKNAPSYEKSFGYRGTSIDVFSSFIIRYYLN